MIGLKFSQFIIKFIYDPMTNIIVMKTDTKPQIIGIIAIIFGIVIILVPQLLSILVGIFLIAYGILEVIK